MIVSSHINNNNGIHLKRTIFANQIVQPFDETMSSEMDAKDAI